MSTTIDQQVVEMRFDNKHFEQNVSTSMSTIDKLKRSLNLTGASKGLENVSAAAKSVDLSPMARGAETVGLKFNAMYTIADQALRNITNSAMAAGKRIVSALTIDPVKSGFQEYETQINAVQTILSNTESKGTQIEDVNAALEELNAYADKTIYNFTEMTRNIGTFTAAGVDLDTSVNAIQGIANLAAMSGSTSQQASTAMYQLSQALASGTVKLMDWNSVVNAGMGGELFQNALKETARVHGVAIDDMIKKQGSFRETLSEGWLTADILTETLQHFTMAAEEGSKEWEAYKKSLMDDGYTEKQAEAILKLSNNATDAATKVKTFTQLWDVLKESAQSGWSQTWKLIIGDYNEAKDLLSPLADTLTGFINKMSDARNRVLQVAVDFATPWKTLMDKLNGSGLGKIKDVVDDVGKVTDKLEYFQKVVDKVWNGDYKNSDTGRFDLLAADGYNARLVQDLVNLGRETNGDYRLTVEDLEKAHARYGLTLEDTKKSTKEATAALEEYSDQKLKDAGLTEDEIRLYRALEKEAKQQGITIEALAKKMSETSGRDLIIESFKNLGDVIIGAGKAAKEAYVEIFDPPSLEELGIKLYGVIDRFKEFTDKLRLTDKETGKLNETGQKLVRVFKGLFAVIDIIATVTGGAFRIAFKVLSSILSYFNMDILDLAANIGDVLVEFRDWLDSLFDVSGAVESVAPFISKLVKGIGELITKVKNSEEFAAFAKYITAVAKGLTSLFLGIPSSSEFTNLISVLVDSGKSIWNWIKTLKDSENIPRDIILGLLNGLRDGVPEIVGAVFELGLSIISGICEVLGIHSPSTVMIAIGGFIIAGLVSGLLEGKNDAIDAFHEIFIGIWNYLTDIVKKIADFLKNVDFGTLLAAGITTGVVVSVWKISDAIQAFSAPLAGLGDMLEEVGDMCKDIGKGVKNYLNSKAVLSMAIAIGILVGVILALAYAMSNEKIAENIWSAVGVMGAIVAMVAALGIVASLMGKIGGEGKIWDMIGPLLAMTGAMVMLAIVAKKLSEIDPSNVGSTLGLLAGLIIGMGLLAAAMGGLNKLGLFKDIWGIGVMLLAMSAALLLMIKVVDHASRLDEGTVKKGLGVVAAIEVMFMAIIAVSKLAGEHGKSAGSLLLKMSFAILIMLGIVKIASGMSRGEVNRGMGVVAGIEILFLAVIAISKLAGEHASKAGGMLFKMAAAMLIMLAAIRIASEFNDDQLKRAAGVIAGVGVIFGALIAVSKLAGEHASEAGSMLLKISIALIILTGVMFLLSLFKPEALAKSLGAIVILTACISALIMSTRLAKNSKAMSKTLTQLMIIVGMLAGIVLILSFIDPARVAVGTAAMIGLMGTFALLMTVTKYTKNTKDVRKGLITMLGVVVLLAGVVALLSLVDSTNALRNTAALSLLMLSLTTSLAIMGKSGKISSTVSKQIYPMLAVVGGLALILGIMSALKVEASIPSAIALGILLNALASALLVMSNAKSMKPSSVGRSLLAMAGLVAVLAGLGLVLAMMSALDVSNAMTNTIALSALLLVITGVAAVLSIIGKSSTNILAGSLGLAALVGVLALLGLVLAMMDAFNIQNSMSNIMALSALLIVITGVAAILALIGAAWVNILAGSLGLAALVGVLALLGLVLAMMEGLELESAMENAKALSLLLATMAVVLVAVSLVGPLALVGVAGLAALTVFMLAVGALAVAVGALVEKFPALESFLDTGIPILEKLAYAVGSIAGNLVAGFADGALSCLPEIGTHLTNFMNNASGFIEGAKNIDESVAAGVGYLSAAILMLTAADLIAGIASYLPNVGSFASLGTELSAFMTNAQPFIAQASLLSEDMLAGVRSLAEVILILTAADVISGLTSWLTGGSSLETFGAQLPLLGTGLRGFADSLGEFSEDQLATVNCAAEAVKKLAQAANEIPNTGGLLASIVGDNELGVFAAQFPLLGTGLRQFLTNVGEFSDDQIATVNCAANAIKTLASASQEIPNTGGLLADIVGDNALGTFAAQFPLLGTGLSQFLTNVGTFSDDQVATVTCAANAVKTLASASQEIPNTGGLLAQLIGDNSLGTFAAQFPKLGTGLADFLTNIGTFSDDQADTITCAANAVKALAEVANSIPNSGGIWQKIVGEKDLGDFGTKIGQLGTGVKSFADNLGTFTATKAATVQAGVEALKVMTTLGNNSVSTAVTNIPLLAEVMPALGTAVGTFVSNMPSGESIQAAVSSMKDLRTAIIEVGGLKQDADGLRVSLRELAEDGIDKFIDAFGKAYVKITLEDAVKTMFNIVIDTIDGMIPDLKDSAEEAADTVISGFDDLDTKTLKQAGRDLGTGLISGMNQKMDAVYAAAYALGQKAVQGEKDGQASASPSKLTIKAGKWLGEGLIIGMEGMFGKVYKTGHEMGDRASGVISNTVSKIADMVNSDIDSQPTIRPVLDLSDVRSGVGALDGMLSSRSSVSMLASVGGISSMMNRRIQNGGNADIISELGKLRKDINNIQGNTYNTIEGITYNDDSQIAGAMQAIIGATRRDRRS